MSASLRQKLTGRNSFVPGCQAPVFSAHGKCNVLPFTWLISPSCLAYSKVLTRDNLKVSQTESQKGKKKIVPICLLVQNGVISVSTLYRSVWWSFMSVLCQPLSNYKYYEKAADQGRWNYSPTPFRGILMQMAGNSPKHSKSVECVCSASGLASFLSSPQSM